MPVAKYSILNRVAESVTDMIKATLAFVIIRSRTDRSENAIQPNFLSTSL